MRSVSVVLILVAVAAVAMAGALQEKIKYEISNAHELFEQFIKDHNKQYKDEEDKLVHFHAFVASLEKINKLNEQDPNATYGLNKFADFTEEERKGMFGLRKKSE